MRNRKWKEGTCGKGLFFPFETTKDRQLIDPMADLNMLTSADIQ
jgi:hypothetical protein